jgi:riboflavin biosynthesis pyrimidine reductase
VTPAGQLDRLRRHRVGQVVLGEGRVDLGGALRLLTQRHRVGAVRVDAGDALNRRCCGPGWRTRVSIVIAPYLAASTTAGPVRLIALRSPPA